MNPENKHMWTLFFFNLGMEPVNVIEGKKDY